MSANKRKPKSPMWRNPRDMIKRHLKRRSSRCLITDSTAQPPSSVIESDKLKLDDEIQASKLKRSSSSLYNPFKHSSPVSNAKKGSSNETLPCGSESAVSECSHGIFDVIKESEERIVGKQALNGIKVNDFPPIDFSSLASTLSRDEQVTQAEHLSERRALKTLPLDLRLGTKLRIESQKPFPWMLDDRPGNYQVRVTNMETDAAIHMIQNLNNKQASNNNAALQEILQYLTKYLKSESLSLTTNISSVARLEASTLYWQFPNIPWTPTFPRFDAARRFIGIKKERAPSINSLGKVFSDSLVAQWFSAFNHLFFSWKKGNRHDFYLCCSAFTVLFTKIQKKNSNEAEDDTCSSSSCTNKGMLNIIITPTTSGFRQQLREEGILFELPLRQCGRRLSHEHGGIYFGLDSDSLLSNDASRASLSSLSNTRQSMVNAGSPKRSFDNRSDVGSDDDEDASGDSDHASWLQEIGVSPKLKKTLTRNLSLSSNNERSMMDSAITEMNNYSTNHTSPSTDVSKTVVLINDPSSIQALFNFLNECKACHPLTGPSAGLPPTLLSVEPFLHSSLSSLSKFSQIVKSNKNELKYICELSNGPIMPHMISQLQLFFTQCPTLNLSGNRLKVQVFGKSFCTALNQALHAEGIFDYNSFEYVVNDELYYLD